MQVLFAGGAGEYCSGSMTPASTSSYLVNLTPGANHSITTETMAFPRVVSPTVTPKCPYVTPLTESPH